MPFKRRLKAFQILCSGGIYEACKKCENCTFRFETLYISFWRLYINVEMKRIVIIAACVLASVVVASAQKNTFGVKAGVNMSGNLLYNMEGKTSIKTGFEVGGFWKHDFGKYFALQPEVAISLQNSDYELGALKQDYMNWSFDIPVYALGQLTTEEGHRAYIGVGPNFGIGFGGKEKISGAELYKDESLMSRFELGASVLVGYEFDFNMQINLSYKYGFFNALKNPVGDARMTRNCVTLGIGYRF